MGDSFKTKFNYQILFKQGIAKVNFSSVFVYQRKSLTPFQQAKRGQPLAEGFPTVLNMDSENRVTRLISANKKIFLYYSFIANKFHIYKIGPSSAVRDSANCHQVFYYRLYTVR